jgi:hypothetical protein
MTSTCSCKRFASSDRSVIVLSVCSMFDVRGVQKVFKSEGRKDKRDGRIQPQWWRPRSKLENPTVVPRLYETAEVSHRVFYRYLNPK